MNNPTRGAVVDPGGVWNCPFARLWAASSLTMLGGQVARVAVYLHVFGETESVAALTAMAVLEVLPVALLGPFGGLAADGLRKHRVLLGAGTLRVLALAAIAADPTPAVICAMLFVQALAMLAFEPVKSACVPLVVPAAQLDRANALEQAAGYAIMVAGPLAGTALAVRLGVIAALGAALALTAAGTLALVGLELPAGGSDPVGGLRRSFAADRFGLRYVARHTVPRSLVTLSVISLLATGLWWPLAPFFVRDALGSSVELVGVQAGVFGIGGLLGSAVAPAVSRRAGRGHLVLVALLSEGLVMLLYSLCRDPVPATLLCLAWGASVSGIVVPYYSILQQIVDGAVLGRVFALAKQGESLAVLASLGTAVALQGRFSAAGVYGLFATVYVVTVAAFATTTSARELVKVC